MKTVFSAEDFKNGQTLLFDKPYKWTSFQVVNKVRWLIKSHYGIRKIKVGHAGTLDPLATGLLLICTGKFTKRIQGYQEHIKEYTGTLTVGATTPSYDLETEIDQRFPTAHLTPELLREKTALFTGDIQQYPPVFSALRKNGKRLYEYARAGEEVQVKPRSIHIEAFELIDFRLPEVDFRVVCSKGTYVRSLAYDFGKAVDSGAHLSALRRTRIGDFHVDQALHIEAFEERLTMKKA